jgi:hypothetical protein
MRGVRGSKEKTSIENVEQIKKADFDKHFKRVKDIIEKSNGDMDKALRLTQLMADKIESSDKAYGRYLVAMELGHEKIADIFLEKYKYLTQSESRKERLAKLL